MERIGLASSDLLFFSMSTGRQEASKCTILDHTHPDPLWNWLKIIQWNSSFLPSFCSFLLLYTGSRTPKSLDGIMFSFAHHFFFSILFSGNLVACHSRSFRLCRIFSRFVLSETIIDSVSTRSFETQHSPSMKLVDGAEMRSWPKNYHS